MASFPKIYLHNTFSESLFQETVLGNSQALGVLIETPVYRIPKNPRWASVGKAFNMAQARVWADPDKTFDGRQMDTLYTADADADATIADLIAEV